MKRFSIILLIVLLILTSNYCAYGLSYCTLNGGPYCENGATPVCSNGLTPICGFDEFMRPQPFCCASINACQGFVLCPDPKPASPQPVAPPSTPPSNPTPPTTPPVSSSTTGGPTTPIIPTIPSFPTFNCNYFTLSYICSLSGKTPNLITCTCNSAGTGTISNSPSCTTCSGFNQCGSRKYCDTNAMCCKANPDECLSGCFSQSDCGQGYICTSNCCLLPKSILVSQQGPVKRNGFTVLIEFQNLDSNTRCNVTSEWNNKKFPTSYSLLISGIDKRTINFIVPRTMQKLISKSTDKSIITLVDCPSSGTAKAFTVIEYLF